MNFKKELDNLYTATKSLDFKTVYIFLSVCIITFISISFSGPGFYYEHFGQDKLGSRLYWFFSDGIMMFLLSVISIKFVLKQKLSDFGFRLGDYKFGLITTLIFFAAMVPVLFIVSNSPDFILTYPQGGDQVKENLSNFLLFEFSILIYMLGWEFLWRGYMLFGLKEKFGYYSIFIQMIPFFILHKGKPELELFASIFAGIILGIQALRANSFIYCWLLHFLIMFSIDTISILKSS
jgi:hypothetical protein